MSSIINSKISFILLFYIFSVSFCLEQSSILLFPFKTKSLQKEEEEDWVEPYQTENDGENEWTYAPVNLILNSSQFINKWFYNGMYIMSNINKKTIETYVNMENSKLSIEPCDNNRIYRETRDKSYYKPLNSDTYTQKENDIGNDIFTVVGDLQYKTNVQIGESTYIQSEENTKTSLTVNFNRTRLLLQ